MFNRTHRYILILLVLLAAIPALFTHFRVQKYFIKFDITESQSGIANRQMIVFRDVNKDRQIERFRFYYRIKENHYRLDVYDEGNNLINSWELPGKWQKDAFSFYDLDNDKYEELYAFIQKKNRIYLCRFDIRKKKFDQYFLFEGVSYNSSIVAYKYIIGRWIDLDQDGMKDLIFALRNTSNVSHVGVLAFSPGKRRILRKSESVSATPKRLHFLDLDGDHKQEIIWSTDKTRTGFRDLPYKANSNWVFFLDQNFDYHTLPIEFPQTHSFLNTLPVQTPSGPRLLVANFKIGEAQNQSSLSLYNGDGIVTKTKNLGNHFYQNTLMKIQQNKQQYILLHRGDNEHIFELYDLNLKKVDDFLFPYGSNLFILQIIKLNGEDIIFLTGKSNLYLCNSHFKLLATFPLEIPFRYFSLSDFYAGNSYFLGISTFYRYQLLKITPNGYYLWRNFVFVPAFLLFFSILSGIYLLFYKLQLRNLLNTLRFHDKYRGILLISSSGNILFINSVFQEYLFPGQAGNATIRSMKNARKSNLTHLILSFVKNPMEEQVSQVSFMHNDQLIRGKMMCLTTSIHLLLPPYYYFEFEDFAHSIQIDRLKTWSESVRKMVHDIKTPLATIGINIESLKLKIANLEEHHSGTLDKNLSTIEKEIQRVRNLSQQFLIYTDLNSPKFEKINLKFILKDCLLPFETDHSSPHSILFKESPQNDFGYNGDPRLLKMAFNVFIENGLQAMPRGGTLTVEIFKDHDENLKILFCDEGEGIDEEVKSKIFEPFFTTKKGGSGLGLAMARKTIEDHGGEIRVDTPPTGGSIFEIIFYRGMSE